MAGSRPKKPMVPKGKPDIKAFQMTPEIEAFVDAAAANEAPVPTHQKPPEQPKRELVPKLVRIPKEMIRAIKRRAMDETEHLDRRVTENDIVERAIAQYLDTKIA